MTAVKAPSFPNNQKSKAERRTDMIMQLAVAAIPAYGDRSSILCTMKDVTEAVDKLLEEEKNCKK